MSDRIVTILTALDLEYQAIRDRMTDVRVHRHERGTRFEVGALPGSPCQVALALTGKGNQASATLVERAIDEFSPDVVFFVGVAGALWPNVVLGDVIVATHVYAYHGGTSEDDGLKARPRTWESSHEVQQIAHSLARTGDWLTGPRPDSASPKVHFGPIAAGEIVQDSRTSYEARWIQQHYNDALAIEMEAAGVAQAGHLSESPVVIVRGISDHADGTKTTTDSANWQRKAAANAAAFAVRLAEELIKEGEAISMRERSTSITGTTVNNSANGVIGIQAAQVTNSTVRMDAPTEAPTQASILDELAAIHDHLARERSSGQLDDDTYQAAKVELSTARDALSKNSTADTNAYTLALKRLRGLVADVAGLAATITALITAAQGLS